MINKKKGNFSHVAYTVIEYLYEEREEKTNSEIIEHISKNYYSEKYVDYLNSSIDNFLEQILKRKEVDFENIVKNLYSYIEGRFEFDHIKNKDGYSEEGIKKSFNSAKRRLLEKKFLVKIPNLGDMRRVFFYLNENDYPLYLFEDLDLLLEFVEEKKKMSVKLESIN